MRPFSARYRDDIVEPKPPMRALLELLLAAGCAAFMLAACATSRADALDARLAAMSNEDLVSYYQGVNDRLKAIQADTRETDRQGTVLQEEPIAIMPYVIGGEAWSLEQQCIKARREMTRRGIVP